MVTATRNRDKAGNGEADGGLDLIPKERRLKQL